MPDPNFLLLSAKPDPGNLERILVVTTTTMDTGETIRHEDSWGYDVTMEKLEDWAARKLMVLNGRDASLAALKDAIGAPIIPADRSAILVKEAAQVASLKEVNDLLNLQRVAALPQDVVDRFIAAHDLDPALLAAVAPPPKV